VKRIELTLLIIFCGVIYLLTEKVPRLWTISLKRRFRPELLSCLSAMFRSVNLLLQLFWV